MPQPGGKRAPKRTIDDDVASGLVAPGFHERSARRAAADAAWIVLRTALRERGIPHQVVDAALQRVQVDHAGHVLKVWREGDGFAWAVDQARSDTKTSHPVLLLKAIGFMD